MDSQTTSTSTSLNQKSKQVENSPSPSPLSSPSHEFSFTITLHPNSPNSTSPIKRSTNNIALDLAPADDIFFHGHLLPLHFLSDQVPTTSTKSPRPSTDSSVQHLGLPSASILKQERSKKLSNSFSSLTRLTKWFEDVKKKKKVFDIKHFLKSVLFSSSSKAEIRNRRPYSFSGISSNPKEREKWMKRRGEFSAPASMRTSPTNSGLLLATPSGYSSSNESSMEELQNAIQAAIAHCKNSTTAAKETQE